MLKPWYTSKILWVNLISILAFIIQANTGEVLDLEAQGAMLAVINIVLRIFTNKGIN